MKITVIVGSLRADSLNKQLAQNLVATIQQIDPAASAVFADLDLPLFNQDIEADFPPAALRLKEQIEAADGLLVVTPEYNHSLTGVLKNAIDWASRPWGHSSWTGKAVAVTGASPGMLGAALAQTEVRRIMAYLGTRVMAAPELYVGRAPEMFEPSGRLVGDEQPFVDKFATAFVQHVQVQI